MVQLVLLSCFLPGRMVSQQPPLSSCKCGQTRGAQLGLEQSPMFQNELDFFFVKIAPGGNESGLQSQMPPTHHHVRLMFVVLQQAEH